MATPHNSNTTPLSDLLLFYCRLKCIDLGFLTYPMGLTSKIESTILRMIMILRFIGFKIEGPLHVTLVNRVTNK